MNCFECYSSQNLINFIYPIDNKDNVFFRRGVIITHKINFNSLIFKLII